MKCSKINIKLWILSWFWILHYFRNFQNSKFCMWEYFVIPHICTTKNWIILLSRHLKLFLTVQSAFCYNFNLYCFALMHFILVCLDPSFLSCLIAEQITRIFNYWCLLRLLFKVAWWSHSLHGYLFPSWIANWCRMTLPLDRPL